MKRKPQDGFNLSFLDVMACGLGAVILIFILVDFKAFTSDPSEEAEKLEQELAASEQQQQRLKQALAEVTDNIARERARQQDTETAQDASTDEQTQLLKDVSAQLAVVADLEQQLAALSRQVEQSANVSVQGNTEQNFIAGLKVEGSHIGLLIDKSASMMGDNLVDVLGKLSLSNSKKKATRKWLRTQRVAKWLVARLPPSANVTMVAFSDTARRVGQQDVSAASVSGNMQAIVDDLGTLVPDGGTNLQLGINTLFEANPSITDVYLVTDGLPTLGEGLSRQCKNAIASTKSISSDCRQALFIETVRRAPKRVRFHIILLPIEGDPYAPSMYWDWSRATDGVFLSPAAEWP